jgi:hypothetical protein
MQNGRSPLDWFHRLFRIAVFAQLTLSQILRGSLGSWLCENSAVIALLKKSMNFRRLRQIGGWKIAKNEAESGHFRRNLNPARRFHKARVNLCHRRMVQTSPHFAAATRAFLRFEFAPRTDIPVRSGTRLEQAGGRVQRELTCLEPADGRILSHEAVRIWSPNYETRKKALRDKGFLLF